LADLKGYIFVTVSLYICFLKNVIHEVKEKVGNRNERIFQNLTRS